MQGKVKKNIIKHKFWWLIANNKINLDSQSQQKTTGRYFILIST